MLLATCHLLLATTSCGFHPLYGQNGGEQTSTLQMLAGVAIETPQGSLGHEFRQDLEDRINPGDSIYAAKAYRLQVTIVSTISAIGVSRDGTVSRYNVYLTSQYKLIRTADNQLMTSGSLTHVSSYSNSINAYFSTYISQEDATRRGIQELAELYRQRLSAYFEEGAPIQKPESNENPAQKR